MCWAICGAVSGWEEREDRGPCMYSSPMFVSDLAESERPDNFGNRYRIVLDYKSEQECPVGRMQTVYDSALEMP